MLYGILLILLIVSTVVLALLNRRDSSNAFLILALFAFLFATGASLVYISQHNYYNYFIVRYFGIDSHLWSRISMLAIPKDWLIRLINGSSLTFIFALFGFSTAFTGYFRHACPKRWIAALLLLMTLAFDPSVYRAACRALYPSLMRADELVRLTEGFTAFSHGVTFLLLAGSVAMLAVAYARSPQIRILRSQTVLVLSSVTVLTLMHAFVLSWAPAFLIKYSRVADYTTYAIVSLNENPLLYRLYPFVMSAATGLLALSTWRHAMQRKRISDHSFRFTRDMNAVEITSRAFCHYMKNEILAMTAEIELADEETAQETLRALNDRCRDIYARLDDMHRSTKLTQLTLMPDDVNEVIDDCLDRLRSHMPEQTVTVSRPEDIMPPVMIDRLYLRVALDNLIDNALDAVKDQPKDEKRISISVDRHKQWVLISIRDAGVGISKEQLQRVFQPFYSTKPLRTHWGIGLSLVYRIVSAHGGRITVESDPGTGTVFRLMLPSIVSSGKPLPTVVSSGKPLPGG